MDVTTLNINKTMENGAAFIYVIEPDRTDYGQIRFLFSTINQNSNDSLYDFGYLRQTTNDEYREKYRALYEGASAQELVVRDKGYIETDSRITAMIRRSIRRFSPHGVSVRQKWQKSETFSCFLRRTVIHFDRSK